MFIGLDMSHASPQSLYERESDIPVSEPTVVGVGRSLRNCIILSTQSILFQCAYTVGHPVLMRGTYWYQEPRVTHIQTEQLTAQLKLENESW
jgi:hypothetical protein